MINFADITKAVKDILEANLTGYQITRNRSKNVDVNQTLVTGSGWIGIYKDSLEYEPLTVGGKFLFATPVINIEIQCSSAISGSDAEDKLQDAEKAVMDVLIDNRTLNDTVDAILSYEINYSGIDFSRETIYFNSASITITTQKKSS